MSLHPIRALDHVIDEYSDYLRTEFRAKDPQLREALERELDQLGFLAQEPFYQAHRPFKPGMRWRDLPIDAKLARVMEDRARSETAYLHQSEAINELLSSDPNPVVVTTGTGSGKTEAFLLPVIQNAFEDATRFKRPGLTAILIYPMNALANDQRERIEDYLKSAGFVGAVSVEQYDRGTPQAKREEMRRNPPHILLTNYMMLEYLLVRPADRDDIFANHRCRYLVLDEVHTYRGILGSNIALLVRRLQVHLRRARQDWMPEVSDDERPKRFPSLIPIGTSATIKSMDEEGLSHDERTRLRDAAVQEFFGTLSGADNDSIKVLGEELQDVQIPGEAAYPAQSRDVAADSLDLADTDAVREALCTLAGLPVDTELADAARRCRLLWDLNRWLISKPMSVGQIVQQLRDSVDERRAASEEKLRREIEAALVIGAALPDGTPGALRLRAHRFVRGGWKFHRCVNPDCGKLYPMGEERCSECHYLTAPLYLCRNCGADYLRSVGDPEEPLIPSSDESVQPEWMIYEPARFDISPTMDDEDLDDEETVGAAPRRRRGSTPSQIKQRPVMEGSVDPKTLNFSSREADYALTVTLVPARTRCVCCGGTAGSRNVITPVALGTSAAVKVVGEGLVEALAAANRNRPNHDGKERLLVFSDSRQDAAHQARFIIFASRYDRMRRRLIAKLQAENALTIQQAIERLGNDAVEHNDNPHIPEETRWIPDEALSRIRSWEEAPLLDEIAVNAGYRGTLINLGLVAIQYHRLDEYIHAMGEEAASRLGLSLDQLEYVCQVVLDEMRTRGSLSRDMLRYHPLNPSCPDHFKQAEWERRMKQPQGYAASESGNPMAFHDSATVVYGVRCHNAWRKPRSGGRGPSLERYLKHLANRFGTPDTEAETIVDLLMFLKQGNFLVPKDLFGSRKKSRLIQVNAEVVKLQLLSENERLRCDVCGRVGTGGKARMPCPRCHGQLIRWSDNDVFESRSVKRILKDEAVPLVAGEHTAQVTTDERAQLEENFKSPAEKSSVNLLACSPTLEMGIDVGGLDAVVMRNIPPRPDNYAQRGGRAGRRSRVGLVVGYARSTPHDQYFYDKPREMIAGEVPAPAMSLGNRDVILRHLNAIVLGSAEPGLAGRMLQYVTPKGEVVQENVDELIEAAVAKTDHAVGIAQEAWGDQVLENAGLTADDLRNSLEALPERIQWVVDCTARQVRELYTSVEFFAEGLDRRHAAMRASELINRLLGKRTESRYDSGQADDRSAGYPLRRFAEFGILPGYEFPSEPAALRLLGDPHEEDPVSVTRRFGIGQFQPDANVYARTKRWKVIGLDTASPWNPRSEGPTWEYRVCTTCDLRYKAAQPGCPRCNTMVPGNALPSYDFAGFMATRNESPILDEEERYAERNLVQTYPQWDGDVVGRWTVGDDWALRLSRGEEVRWVNEGRPLKPKELKPELLVLHPQAKGYLLCPSCGRILPQPEIETGNRGGRRNTNRGERREDTNGHAESCPIRGSAARPLAIGTSANVEILRLVVPLPASSQKGQWESWGLSLGYALLAGMQHHFMLGASELDFELEGPWLVGEATARFQKLSLAFIDPSLGGSGYLPRIAESFHYVAERALDHLNHRDCETACYRCLKSYQNQRYHDQLAWPQSLPALQELSQIPSRSRPLETGDIDDPRPWLEAYAAGVGSPLELKFLRLFEQHSFHPQKQVPVSPTDGDRPISVADFAVPERRLAIYVDGAAFHVGERLRRDAFIRQRLEEGEPPWRIEVLHASDLALSRQLVSRLMQ